jgi:hypothetical protein
MTLGSVVIFNCLRLPASYYGNVAVTKHITLLNFYGVRVNINAFAARNVVHVYRVTLAVTTHDVAFIARRLFCAKLRKNSPKCSKF